MEDNEEQIDIEENYLSPELLKSTIWTEEDKKLAKQEFERTTDIEEINGEKYRVVYYDDHWGSATKETATNIVKYKEEE